jgi:hypothetical protein
VKRQWMGSDDGNQSTRKATGKKAWNEIWNDGRERGSYHNVPGKDTTERGTTADEIQHELQKLIGPSTAWKTKEQGETMEKILSMSGGKNVLFMLSALIKEAGTSIVVFPFTALTDDLMDRAQQSGMDCIR